MWRFYLNRDLDFPIGYFLLSMVVIIGLVYGIDYIYKRARKKKVIGEKTK